MGWAGLGWNRKVDRFGRGGDVGQGNVDNDVVMMREGVEEWVFLVS